MESIKKKQLIIPLPKTLLISNSQPNEKPLVNINISDHYTRVKSQSLPPPATPHCSPNGVDALSFPPTPPPRVFGVQRGSTTNSLDRAFIEKKQQLCVYLVLFLVIVISFRLLCFTIIHLLVVVAGKVSMGR